MTDNQLDFSQVMDKLQAIAEKDGQVTEEETNFLNSIAEDVEKYEDSVLTALQDEFISDDEFHELVILRDNILNKAMNFNSESDDVNNLVKELFEEINSHEIPGMVDDEKLDSDEEPVD